MQRFVQLRMIALVAVLGLAGPALHSLSSVTARATDNTAPDKARIEQARTTVKMLDDAYKAAVVSITETYVAQQSDAPAATVAKKVFAFMKEKGWHQSRLIDATGKPKNPENVAKTDFEKAAVARLKAGETYYEEVGETNGKPVLRAATIVPVVMKECTVCHGRKQGSLLGAIIYELPIK